MAMRLFALFAVVAALLTSPLCHADHAVTATLSADMDAVTLDKRFLSFFEDARDQWALADVVSRQQTLFHHLDSTRLEVNQVNGAIWAHARVELDAAVTKPEEWLVTIDYAMLKRLDIHVLANGKYQASHRIGYEMPMSARDIPYSIFVQPLHFEPGVTYDLYFNARRKNGSIKIPLQLQRPDTLIKNSVLIHWGFGIMFGVLLAMALYNLFVLFSVRERIYLYYVLYIIFSSTAILTVTGYGYLILWPSMPHINDYVLALSICLAAITGLEFGRHFVRQDYDSWVLNRAIDVFIVIGCLIIAYKLTTDHYIAVPIMLYLGALAISTPIFSWIGWRNGSRAAGIFILSWSVLLVGVVIYLLTLIKVLPVTVFTANAALIGAALEVIILSWSLADRISRAKRTEVNALRVQHESAMQIKDAEEKMLHRALHHLVSGMPNRAYLRTHIDSVSKESNATQFALLIIRLENYHEFTHTLGQSNGDTILQIGAEMIDAYAANLPEGMLLESTHQTDSYTAHLDGAIFALMLRELENHRLQDIGLQLIQTLEKPFEFRGLHLSLDVGIGIALAPSHGSNSETLLRNAHIALEAGHETVSRVAIYSQKIDPYNERRLSLVSALKKAIEKDQLELYFQPQLSLSTSAICGAEVLVRWRHDDYGVITPDEFVPLAERTGIIQALTFWVIEKTFAFKQSLDEKHRTLRFAINISARNLQDIHFCSKLVELAREYQVSLTDISLELTETAIMHDPEQARMVMRQLSEAGVELSIDDYGTGHASLSYIRRLPINEIKIDRSFIYEMASNHDDQVIVDTTLMMGHNLKLNVVAEGIEDYRTLNRLREMGCDIGQGYLIARPMPTKALLEWLHKHQHSAPILRVVEGDKA